MLPSLAVLAGIPGYRALESGEAGVIALDSDLRPGADPTPLVRVAGEAGFDGIAVGFRGSLRDLPLLGAAALGAGLGLPVVSVPIPPAPLMPHKRLPRLAAPERDEREAAVALCDQAFQVASPFGVVAAIVDLGPVTLSVSAAEVMRSFHRGELRGEPDDDGAERLAEAWAERRARAGALADACRFSFDRLVGLAERHQLSVAVDVAAHPWCVPGPRELLALLDEYEGAPLGAVLDEARLSVLEMLGAAVSEERRSKLATAATAIRANEPVGLATGYLPGLGDPPAGRMKPLELERLPPIVVAGRPDSTDDEVVRSRVLVAAAFRPAPPTAD